MEKIVKRKQDVRLQLLVGYCQVCLVKKQQYIKDLSYQLYFLNVGGRLWKQPIDYKILQVKSSTKVEKCFPSFSIQYKNYEKISKASGRMKIVH